MSQSDRKMSKVSHTFFESCTVLSDLGPRCKKITAQESCCSFKRKNSNQASLYEAIYGMNIKKNTVVTYLSSDTYRKVFGSADKTLLHF